MITLSWDTEIKSEMEISYYPFTLLSIGKQAEIRDFFQSGAPVSIL